MDLLSLLVLLTGLWTHNALPTYRQGSSGCGSVGSPYAASQLLFVRAHVGPIPEVGYDFQLGYWHAGDTLRVVLSGVCCGWTPYFLSSSADSGATWSCWSRDSSDAEPFNASSDWEIAGDLDGDGQVNALDLAMWAEAQARAPKVYLPGP